MKIRNLGIVFGTAGLLGFLSSAYCINISNGVKVNPPNAESPKQVKEVNFYDPWTNKPFDVDKDVRNNSFREGLVYSDSEVPVNMCSRYARLAARDMFGINYPSADAWDIRDDSKVSKIPLNNSQKEIISLVVRDILKPGMLIGVYNPKSAYNARAKEDGAGYTHVMLYIGQGNGEFYFADKFGKKTRTKVSLTDVVESGLEPREVLFINK